MKLLRGLAIISTTAAIPQADGGEETWPEISDDGPVVPPEFDRNFSAAPMGFAGRSSASARNVFFNPKAGYIVAEHKEDCWTKCGRRSRWSGKCSYCNLSNGSPGFCCHPDGRGSGCTGGMIRAVRNARMGRQYQCVVPKEFDSITSTSLKVLDKRDCWAKCGSIKGFAGKCDYCGPQGYCCNADGRGECPGQMSTLLAFKGIRGNRCVVPATTMGDHRLETSARSRCKSIKVSQCRTLSSFINGKQSFNRQRNRF